MKRTVVLIAAVLLLLLAACSSSTPTVRHSATTPVPTATAASTTAAASTSDIPAATGTIDLSPNWTAMVAALKSGYAGRCLLDYACTGTNPPVRLRL